MFKLAGVNDADIATVAVGLVLVIVTFITVSFSYVPDGSSDLDLTHCALGWANYYCVAVLSCKCV